MAFRYINPGYVSLLDSNVTATEVAGTTYSKTGTGFSQTNSAAGITIPQFASGDDFWAKFDAYIPSGVAGAIYFFMPNSNKVGFSVEIPSSPNANIYIYCNYNNTRSTITYGTRYNLGINIGGINTFLIHIVPGDSSTSQWELWINGKEFSADNKSLNYYDSYSKVAVIYSDNYTTGQNVIFSNVIFSDEEIFQRERVIALPINTTATDMTAGENGIYIANAANQTLLQTPDVASLITDYGANSTITGVALVGNPAYKTATGLAALTSLSRAGTSTIEHGTCNLSDDTSAVIVDGWATENLTIADLQNMQFGWKAGT